VEVITPPQKENLGGFVKASLVLLFITLAAAKAATAAPATTQDLSLNCHGMMKVVKVDSVQHATTYLSTRSSIPHIVKFSLADVQFEITQASADCVTARAQFQLPFAVTVGMNIPAKVSHFGHVSQSEMLAQVPLNSESSFQIQQTFYTANEKGELPVFPLYHVEKIDFVVKGPVPENKLGINLGESGKPVPSGWYFSNYKFLNPLPYYGVASPKAFTAEEKLAQAYKIIKLAKASNLEDDLTLKIVAEALSAFQPSSFYDFKDNDPAYQEAIKKHLDSVIPFLNQYTDDVTVLKTSNDDTQSIFRALQSTIDFSLLPPFSHSPEDTAYVVNQFVAMPLILQAETGTLFELSAKMIEQFLSQAKDALPSTSSQKVAQLKATVSYLKQKTPSYLLSEQSVKLIGDILSP
jgi:hypothetical protein